MSDIPDGACKSDFEMAVDGVEILFDALSIPETAHTVNSPPRIAKMYMEFFQVGQEEPRFTTFPSESTDMVLVRDIHFYSLCSHHFLPFFGLAHIAYIPSGRIAGLSKLARVVQYYSHRPQVQEELTTQVADYLQGKLHTSNVAVIMSCEHLCMSMRGVHSPGHQTVTTALRGGFFNNDNTRAELYHMLGVPGK